MELEPHAHFFHYTTRQAAFGSILPEGRLRFSRYMDMRDPLENKLWRFAGGGSGDDAERQIVDYFEFNRLANYLRERSFLLSMTIDVPPEEKTGEEEPFCWGWARARMWEQYAENHEGVCLVFEREGLINAVEASLREQGFAVPYHGKVIYDGSRMRKPPLDLDALAGNVTPQTVAEYIRHRHEVLFFHKARDWETEREYRFSTTSSDKERLFVEFGNTLVAVIVGERLPIWQRLAAIGACESVNARPIRLDWSMGLPMLGHLRSIESRRDEIREHVENSRGAAPPVALPPPPPRQS